MSATLRFLDSTRHILLSPDLAEMLLVVPDSVILQGWSHQVAELLDTGAAVVNFRLSRLRWSVERSRQLAHAIARRIRVALQQRSAPETMYVEIDLVQQTAITAGRQVRTLLPHHDGGHCTYLTPSCKDVPDWNPAWRRFSHQHFTTTQAHKLYQGIFMLDPGEGLSITTYYDLLHILRDAWTYQRQSFPTIPELATWLGAHISTSLQRQDHYQSRYLSIGTMLGSQQLIHHVLAVHHAESDFTSQEYMQFPELQRFQNAATPTHSPIECYLDEVFMTTLGIDWEAFRLRYETAVPSEQCDFILGHNLTLLHGGLMGGVGRSFEPICLVIDNPIGNDYEHWLATAWRRK
jgi:hypothetical protein